MRLLRSEKRMLAAASLGLALMLLLSSVNGLSAAPLAELPAPASPSGEAREGPRDLVDINAAGLDELMGLPNIGPARAQAILDWRAEHGPFRYPEDLIRVEGIGEGIASGLLDYVTTGGGEYAEDLSGG